LKSPYIKDKNKENIKIIKNLDLKKNKNKNKVENNMIYEEVNIDNSLGEDE